MVQNVVSTEDDGILRHEPDAPKASSRITVDTCIGTPADANRVETARALTTLVNRAYQYHRVSEWDMQHRLRAGRNRVLHVAVTSSGQVVGCCSSTLFTPWCEPGCGHWGLLAVDVDHQGSGVATALVKAAERRLAAAGMRRVQMEYSCAPPGRLEPPRLAGTSVCHACAPSHPTALSLRAQTGAASRCRSGCSRGTRTRSAVRRAPRTPARSVADPRVARPHHASRAVSLEQTPTAPPPAPLRQTAGRARASTAASASAASRSPRPRVAARSAACGSLCAG